MSSPLLNTVSVAAATRQIFRYLAVVHFAAGAVILTLGQFTAISFAALLFIGASALVNRLRAYRRSPFALIASVVICLYFVIPLAFIGDRKRIYRYPPAKMALVHDWMWRPGGEGARVSWLLLKRLNLVTR